MHEIILRTKVTLGLDDLECDLSFCRKDMQNVLAEVTDHMEQQYSAHRYLEKLRSENENIALKEKERTVRNRAIQLDLS